MQVWVYEAPYGALRAVYADGMTTEEFATQWCEYFPENIYFFAELVSI